jgi:hypothetical protein
MRSVISLDKSEQNTIKFAFTVEVFLYAAAQEGWCLTI